MNDDAAFRQQNRREGDLGQLLCEHLWGSFGTYYLGGEEFEVVIANEEVPGYEGDDMTLLLRRTSDGQVFEAEIEPRMRPVGEVARHG